MIKQFILLLIPFLFVGCGNADNKPDLSNTAPEKDPLEEAVDWAKLQNRNGDAYLPNTDVPYSGWAKRTFENGQVEVLVQFDEGSITKIKRWQENGIPQFEAGFIKGKVNLSIDLSQIKNVGISSLEGTITEWHSNGQKSAENFVKHGKRSGKANAWFENGQISDLLNFKNGKKEGLQKSWHENGQIRSEEHFREGEKDGTSRMWHENGQKWIEATFKIGQSNGKAFNWYENGQLKFEGTFRNGERDSLITEWYPDGQKQSESNYSNDMKNGTSIEWRPDGQLEKNATYKEDVEVISVRFDYYDNGQKKSEINYKNGKKDGSWTSWDINGKIEYQINYIEDSYSKTSQEAELDQFQNYYIPQSETSFSKINDFTGNRPLGNWFSFTAQKNGFLKQISLLGVPNSLDSELYGSSMGGFIKKGSLNNTSKVGEWSISTAEIAEQIKSQGIDRYGWISIKINGIVPQNIGEKYFFVCNEISDGKSWFGAFCFSNKNPYKGGEFWLNPNHDLVFCTFVSAIPSMHGNELIHPSILPKILNDEALQTDVEQIRQSNVGSKPSNSKGLYEKFFNE